MTTARFSSKDGENRISTDRGICSFSSEDEHAVKFKENLYKAIRDPNFDPDEFIDRLLA
ncbi:MAG: hypothetical protein OIF36_02775 [Alphaproteobacteria bacterium]|jgi:hypothetical protein|nr:hypothetical protein [Alphaproteobacteria bacterium]MCV6599387.1 hypothetical protein [Alphaproteobacteria bacterium]